MQMSLDLAFKFESAPIHAFLFREKPAFIASEVGAAIGISDANQAVRRSKLLEDGVDYVVVSRDAIPLTVSDTVTPRSPAVTVLFETGLYGLVLRSDKPAAMRFTRWVMRDVLPEINRSGSFSLLPEKIRPDQLEKNELLILVREAGRGNGWAKQILTDLGFREAGQPPAQIA